jgi:hypothetical protein
MARKTTFLPAKTVMGNGGAPRRPVALPKNRVFKPEPNSPKKPLGSK